MSGCDMGITSSSVRSATTITKHLLYRTSEYFMYTPWHYYNITTTTNVKI